MLVYIYGMWWQLDNQLAVCLLTSVSEQKIVEEQERGGNDLGETGASRSASSLAVGR